MIACLFVFSLAVLLPCLHGLLNTRPRELRSPSSLRAEAIAKSGLELFDGRSVRLEQLVSARSRAAFLLRRLGVHVPGTCECGLLCTGLRRAKSLVVQINVGTARRL